ncbi:hypothetical protein ACN08Y_10360 [Rothia sp. P5764]|uniref:hypothetical protein n=1 Tax=Rothia sp. P5764 TaxID=3402654 RepID=UPI003AD473B4
MTEKNYPEEIYLTPSGAAITSQKKRRMVEKAYNMGLANGRDPLAGFSNLTEAIQDGAQIDWSKLDGRKAKCFHFLLGTLTFRLDRNPEFQENYPLGWVKGVSTIAPAWKFILEDAWEGCGGWSLWVEGEIPLKLRTADELEPGTGFLGKDLDSGAEGNWITYKVDADPIRAKLINPKRQEIDAPADEIEVIQAYGPGTFQTTSEGGSVSACGY